MRRVENPDRPGFNEPPKELAVQSRAWPGKATPCSGKQFERVDVSGAHDREVA
ncbi:MAG TPA: hypothetical protein VK691_12030 [Solirubrobacteraceae bacterium]|nr:hypothetical protein [Solirubrobacteraceae bacterium]